VTDSSVDVSFLIEPLQERHDRVSFSSGVAPLDHYLQKQARQDLTKRVAAVFVATPDGKRIAGFYTLSATTLDFSDLPPDTTKKLPRYPRLPATLLGRLAVSVDFRGQGLGEILVMDALKRSLVVTRQVASMAVVVDAKDDQAVNFYLHHGFMALPSQPRRLFYLMNAIARL
jgi:predicted GNAT family N-acyltransferase